MFKHTVSAFEMDVCEPKIDNIYVIADVIYLGFRSHGLLCYY